MFKNTAIDMTSKFFATQRTPVALLLESCLFLILAAVFLINQINASRLFILTLHTSVLNQPRKERNAVRSEDLECHLIVTLQAI